MKKTIKILLSFVMTAGLFGCSQPATSTQDFEAFTKELIPELLPANSSVINSLYENPESYGLIPETYEHSFMSLEDFEEAIEEDKRMLEQLHTYDYSSLSKDEQITYDLLENYLNLDLKLEDKYYLINNNFDVNGGLHAGLTLDLYFYNFRNKQDIESFLNLLSTADDAFDQYVAFELERQNQGYGMSKTYLEHVIDQVETFNEGNHEYLLEHASEELAAADFLSEEEKESYYAQIEDAYRNDLLAAYQDLEEDLKALPTPSEEYLSLADYEGGKEYYAYLVETDTGFSDMEEYRAYLQEKQQSAIFSFILYMQMNEEVSEKINNNDFSYSMTSLTTMQDVLKYLEDTAFESGNFPEIGPLNYEMEVVPESMQDIFLASAAYYLSPYDSDNDVMEHMILNGEFSSDSYTTLAHEGIPGHMYQHNYFKQVEHNHLRDLLGNSGYQEAWATYVSKYMVQYSDEPEMAHVMELNANISYLLILELDLMIHYDGISTEGALEFLMTNFGMDEATAELQYTQLIEGPAIFVPYYGYFFRFMDLKEMCQEADESLRDHDFHQMVLDLGALPYPLLEKYVLEELNIQA